MLIISHNLSLLGMLTRCAGSHSIKGTSHHSTISHPNNTVQHNGCLLLSGGSFIQGKG